MHSIRLNKMCATGGGDFSPNYVNFFFILPKTPCRCFTPCKLVKIQKHHSQKVTKQQNTLKYFKISVFQSLHFLANI